MAVRSPLQKALNTWAIILIAWSIYRAYFKTDLPVWFDEFVAKPFVFIVPVFYYISRHEGKPVWERLNLSLSGLGRNIILGTIIGITFFISGAAGILIREKNIMHFISQLPAASTLLYYGALALVTSISEEIVSRGFILKRLYEESGNILSSSFFASILFFFLHVPILFTNTSLSGDVLLRVMFTDLVLSLAVSFIFLDRKSLVLPILIHTFYALSLYLFT